MTQEELDNDVIFSIMEELSSMKTDIQVINNQLVQLRKDNQLLRTQLSNLTKSHHHQSQSMY